MPRLGIRSKKGVSAALPAVIVIGVIIAILGGYYVVTVLPGSLPTSIVSEYTGTSSTLTGNFTSTSVAYVGIHSKVVNYSTIYINNGAAIGREPAFNPMNTTLVIGLNNTVYFKNADYNQTQVVSPSAGLNSGVLNSCASATKTNPCVFEFVFTTAGTYYYWCPLYPNPSGYFNGTITVIT